MKKFKKEIIISRSAYVVVEAETLEEAMELFENGEWEAGDGGEEFIDRTTYSEWDEEFEEWVDVDPDDNE